MVKPFQIVVGRIETQNVDAVVNAANRWLAPGTGVDGALRAAAGPELTPCTAALAPIDIGDAVLTPGFNLRARHIIHTAAPIFTASANVDELIAGLARCYASSLTLAARHDFTSIAFPCLGTGNFGWPRDLACQTALAACNAAPYPVSQIVFCCFSDADAAPYRLALGS